MRSAPVSAATTAAQNGDAPTSALEVCDQRLLKVLDALEQSEKENADLKAEISTVRDLLGKQQLYDQNLLDALNLLISAEKRNKKFFEKVREQTVRILKNATEPKSISTIVSIILILDKLKKLTH